MPRRRALSPVALPLTLALCAVPLLAGCGGEPLPGEEFGQVEQAAVVCADGTTTPGIDVSYYQGNINWAAVAGAGVRFAISRVNHGDFLDPKFAVNWEGSRQAGLIRGAYQYFDPGGDPVKQAGTFVSHVGELGPGDLPGVIDVESTDGRTPAQIAANVATWVDLVEAGTGRRPMVYTGSYFWNDNVNSTAFADHPLWIAHYTNNCPNLPNAWQDWTMWQYTASGSVAGIAGNVDRNRFNGSLEALHDLAADGYRAEVVALTYPEVLAAGELGTATLTLRNAGARTWTVDTRVGTTVPRDRESPFAAPAWLGTDRAATVGEVASDEEVTVTFDLLAPLAPGTYTEHFNLVHEGVAWFSDIAPGGGPSDDAIALTITVTASGAPSSVAAGSGGAGSTVAAGTGTGGGDGDAVVARGIPNRDPGGCTAAGRPSPSGLGGTPALLLLGAAGWCARRRRRDG